MTRSASSQESAVDLMRNEMRTEVAVLFTFAPASESQDPWKYSTRTVDDAGDECASAHGASLVVADEHPAAAVHAASAAKALAAPAMRPRIDAASHRQITIGHPSAAVPVADHVLVEEDVAMSAVVARAFWGSRPQALSDGVAAIVATLTGLRELDDWHFARWFAPGDSRRNALEREIAVDPDGVSAYVDDRDGDMGYSFWAWNGLPEDDALSFNCAFATTSKWLTNRVVFEVPSAWEHDLDRARQALDLVLRVWRPEKANVWNSERVDLVVADL